MYLIFREHGVREALEYYYLPVEKQWVVESFLMYLAEENRKAREEMEVR